MRVVKESAKGEIRITILSWNNKYLLKFEEGPFEQTYKIPEFDILEEGDLEKFLEGDFFISVQKRFKEMGQSLQNQLENI